MTGFELGWSLYRDRPAQSVTQRYQPKSAWRPCQTSRLALSRRRSRPSATCSSAPADISRHSQPLASLGVSPTLEGLQDDWKSAQECRKNYLARPTESPDAGDERQSDGLRCGRWSRVDRGGRVPRLVSVCRAPGSPGRIATSARGVYVVTRSPGFTSTSHPNSLRMHPQRPHRSASTRWCIPHQAPKPLPIRQRGADTCQPSSSAPERR